MNIVAADYGKFNSMFCFYDSDTREHTTAKAPTDRSYFHSVFKSQQPDLIVVEACGPSGWVSDLCQELNFPILGCSRQVLGERPKVAPTETTQQPVRKQQKQ